MVVPLRATIVSEAGQCLVIFLDSTLHVEQLCPSTTSKSDRQHSGTIASVPRFAKHKLWHPRAALNLAPGPLSMLIPWGPLGAVKPCWMDPEPCPSHATVFRFQGCPGPRCLGSGTVLGPYLTKNRIAGVPGILHATPDSVVNPAEDPPGLSKLPRCVAAAFLSQPVVSASVQKLWI